METKTGLLYQLFFAIGFAFVIAPVFKDDALFGFGVILCANMLFGLIVTIAYGVTRVRS